MTYADLSGLMTRMTGDEKHEAGATSTLDVLWVLYDSVLSIDPENPRAEGRDRFFLSKGHGPTAYYAVLAAKGFIPLEALDTFGAYDSPLGHHPDRVQIPGVEVSSGSLGHGLPMAVGAALGLRAKRMNQRPRVFCLLGDAELEEGSNAEAICFAGRRALGGLTAIVIDNRSSSLGWPGGIGRRFELEAWRATDVDGRDHDAIRSALSVRYDVPHVVVARTEAKE